MSSITKYSDVNVGILIERIRYLEYLLSNIYKVPGGTEISFDLRTLLGINPMDVYLILFWIANNFYIKIEDNKFIINVAPLNVEMVDNNVFNKVMSGGTPPTNTLVKYKKDNELIRVGQMLGWRLLWLFMWIMIFFTTLQTFRYFFIDSMRTLSEINVSTFNGLIEEVTNPHGLKDPIFKKVSELMEKYKNLRGSSMDSNGREEENNYNYGLAEIDKINVLNSFYDNFDKDVKQLQLPSPYNNDSYVKFDDNVTNELFPMYKLYLDILFSSFQAGDPFKLGDLFNPLDKHFESRMKDLRKLINEQQQKIYKLKGDIEEFTAEVGKDLENTERVISSSTPILTAAADYTTDFFKFMSGATPTSKVAQHHQKLFILMELLRLLPRVSNHITTAIPNTIGDIYSIHNNLQTISNMCMAMYVISGIITYIIQTVFYYIIVAILKVGGGDKDTKVSPINARHIFEKLLDKATEGKLSPAIIIFMITESQLNEISDTDIANNVASELKFLIGNDHKLKSAFECLCNYLKIHGNAINLRNLYDRRTALSRNVIAAVNEINISMGSPRMAIGNTDTDEKNEDPRLLITDGVGGGRRKRKRNKSKKPRKKQKSKKTRRKMRKSKKK